MRKRITINNNLINGPGNVPPTQPTSPTTPTSPTQPTQPTPPVPPLENILFIGRNGGITVYDVARNQVITEIESTGTPNDIFINQPMNVLYATSQQGLSVIDLSTYQLIAQTPVPMSGIFNEIGYNPDNNTVYVGADFRVFGFDASNNYELIATIDVPRTGGTSGRFALNPSTSLGYLPVSPFNMYVLDLLNNSWASTINTAPNYAGSVATNAATNFIYNTNSSTSGLPNVLTVIDGNTNTVVTTIPLEEPGNLSSDLSVDEINNRIYVTNLNTGNSSNVLAYVIDANTNTLLGTINLDRNVNTRSVSINADARRAYLSDLESDSIYVIDTVTNNVIQELPFRAFALASYTP